MFYKKKGKEEENGLAPILLEAVCVRCGASAFVIFFPVSF
jgi:hypothetical protein